MFLLILPFYIDSSISIEHSENKIITQSEPFQNEIGPGVFQCVQRSTKTSVARIPKAQTMCNRLCVISVLIL